MDTLPFVLFGDWAEYGMMALSRFSMGQKDPLDFAFEICTLQPNHFDGDPNTTATGICRHNELPVLIAADFCPH